MNFILDNRQGYDCFEDETTAKILLRMIVVVQLINTL